jgi:hypothetical protein
MSLLKDEGPQQKLTTNDTANVLIFHQAMDEAYYNLLMHIINLLRWLP